ncbi:MAG: GNAT family N-acetyltransferase [Bacteroidetes bacterium]|nr:GNAT family N-acetyltransferase [Bacteroidota bacterium]
MKIIEPTSPEEFEKYYKLRWEVLRAPWGKPEGTEKDELELQSIHALAIDDAENAIGVVRLNGLSKNEAQIRYMGVKNEYAGKGIGSLLINHIENKSKEAGYSSIILHSRENAVEFYLRNDYQLIKPSYLMWGEIQHFLMQKLF